ncbi:MAG: EamA family transporter [Elusimicrobiota bacterium]
MIFRSTAPWWFYALLSAFFAALTAILAKIGIKGVDSDLATAVRTAVILLMVCIVVFVKNGMSGIFELSKTNLIFLSLSGIATGLSWLFYFRALQLGKVSNVAPVDKTSVAIAILLSVIFLHETITFKAVFGALLIIAGTIIVII